MSSDPIKGYHRQVYESIIDRIKFQKKKKAFKKEQILQQHHVVQKEE
jgi:hypothetical protein